MALIFNVHADSVSTTSAHGSIRIGVSSLIITAFGLARRSVALFSKPTIASVTAPNTAPAIINFQSISEVIVDASRVSPPHNTIE